jgi:hypothetical protein
MTIDARIAEAFERPLEQVLLVAGYWVSPGP